MNKLENSIKIIYKKCLNLKKKESLLIVYDKNKKALAKKFFEIGKRYSSSIMFLETPLAKIAGTEPPKYVSEAMLKNQVQLLITTKSLSHTKARKTASKNGARIATLPGVKTPLLRRAIDINYKAMNKLNKKIINLMDKANSITIITKKGTNIIASIKGRKGHGRSCGIFHKKGSFGNLPDGEAFIAPVEGTANGVFIVDASMAGIEKVKDNIEFTVKNGFVTKIKGKKEAEKLKKAIKHFGKYAKNIAEIGIGTNPKAKVIGNVLEDEKVMGTAHIAIGNNFGFGGKVKVPLHLDGVFKKPTIFIDKKKVMEEGKFLI